VPRSTATPTGKAGAREVDNPPSNWQCTWNIWSRLFHEKSIAGIVWRESKHWRGYYSLPVASYTAGLFLWCEFERAVGTPEHILFYLLSIFPVLWYKELLHWGAVWGGMDFQRLNGFSSHITALFYFLEITKSLNIKCYVMVQNIKFNLWLFVNQKARWRNLSR